MKTWARYFAAAALFALPVSAQAGTVDSGFRDFTFPANDDGATGALSLGFTANFFGNSYSNAFVSNNGYLTFNSGQGTYTPSGLGTDYSGQPIIAAFFADVDTRSGLSALTSYGTGTYKGKIAFGATWDGVGYFPSAGDKLNSFQTILTDRSDTGDGNFDIYFNYDTILWETGSASGGSNGFGGVSAAVGFNAGNGNAPGTFFELPGSRVPGSFLDGGTMSLASGTNNGTPGQLQFQVRNGMVIVPTVPGVPEPATWMMMIVGFGICGAGLRQQRRRSGRLTLS